MLLEQVVERVRFERVPGWIVTVLEAVAQRPPNFRRACLRPPAIELGKVDAAVYEHLHAARAAGFPRAPRCVDPDVYALDESLGEQHVVVAQEDDVGSSSRLADEVDPIMDQGLPRLVLRVGLAGDDKLYRTTGDGQESQQSLRVVEKQVRSLVGRKPTREAEGQGLWVE